MKKILLLGFLIYTLPAWAITAELSSDEIQQGQSVELILSSDKPIPSVDFTPLTSNFMLAGQSSRQASQFINGVGSTTYQKSIVLFPIKEGKLEIPALTVGTETTPVLTLNVKKQGNSKKQSNQPIATGDNISLTAQVGQKKLYIGQNTLYTLTIKNSGSLASAEIVPSTSEGIKLSPVGQDKAMRKNNYEMIERQFLLKPEKSGELTVAPALLNGEILYQSNQKINGKGLFSLLNTSQFMDAFSSGIRPIQIISNPVQLTIHPKPSDWEGWWIPSTNVVLNLMPEIPQNLKAGDTFHVDLTLEALNVDSNDLPVPKFQSDPNFRFYPEPEERHSTLLSEGNLKSSVKVGYTIMPLTAGQQNLPQIEIPWFDVQSETKKIAKSMPLTLNVGEGQVENIIKPALPVSNKIPRKEPQNTSLSTLLWLSIGGAFILGILITLGTFFFLKKKSTPKKKEKPIPDFYPF